MDTITGANIYEVCMDRIVTTTEKLSIFVRADNEDQAADRACAKLEFGGGHVTNSRTGTEVCTDNYYVQFVSKVAHAEPQYD